MLTKEEYERRSHENSRVDGYGLDGMTIHSPCPFCAAPDFHVYTLITMRDVTSRETICKECKRGLRVDILDGATSTVATFWQTCGDDPPDYLPKFPRAPTVIA